MMVSKKMMDAALDNLTKDLQVDSGAVAQAVVNAAWVEFGAEDETTWPKTTEAPSGQMWFIEVQEQEDYPPYTTHDTWTGDDWMMSFNIIRYADPADLIFKETE